MRASPVALLIVYYIPIVSANAYWDAYATRIDSTRSNQGALTTTFTPPSSCFTPTTQAYYGYPSMIIGCPGPGRNNCCPPDWNWNVYFSPGVCPSGYKACTLPTTTQRKETTEICCPSNYACSGQDWCVSSLETISTMTYTDSTLSTESPAYAITATPIQIRYKAAQSTIIPIATPSFDLPMPKHELDTREKVGIGIGVPVAVGLLGAVLFFGWRRWREKGTKKGVIEGPMGIGSDLEREWGGEHERARQIEREREIERAKGVEREVASGTQRTNDVETASQRAMEMERAQRELDNERDPPPAYNR
ncbi:hypothetical protein N7478_000230 [Penicillium angulare]|uniref:uncharacterized protein n=1 Tax=Penicillium angulare TaxID=116970 RepID=UPI002540481A|nr:uncharacterized protein N7478_000230 [Penicillium angulare]KAJ5290979.1 hypothetical protein N7478_000230 [Penicillium angulare]